MLANAVGQSNHCWLTRRFREQARSHKGMVVFSGAGQADDGGEAAARGFFQIQLSAQTLRGFAGDGHAEADAAGVAVA